MPRPTEARAISTAGGGTAVTTTAQVIPAAVAGKCIGPGRLELLARNFATGALVVKFAVTPRLAVLRTVDGFAAAPTDFSDNAQDGVSGTVVTLNAQPAAPNGFIYLGGTAEFRGVVVGTPGNANAVASVASAEFWNGSAWVAASAGFTDGTTSGGATFAVAGNIVWTVPTTWQMGRLADILALRNTPAFMGQRGAGSVQELLEAPLFWIRLKVSAALTATVDVASIMALARTTKYAEIDAVETIAHIVAGPSMNTTAQGFGGVEVLTDQGTANLIANLVSEFTS